MNVFPSVYANKLMPNANQKPVSKRSKRMVRRLRCTALNLVCLNCHTLEKENRRLRNRIVTLEEQAEKRESKV